MGQRLDDVVADVAWGARGIAIPCNALMVYSGPAWPGLGQLQAWGLPWMVGFESTTTRAYGGAPAADADMAQLLWRIRSEVPDYIDRGCGFWWCAADASSTPDWALPAVRDYGARMHELAVAAGWSPKAELPYGNRAASTAGVDGARAAGARAEMWGVGTWGFGEQGWAYALPPQSDAWLLQSGNTPGPVPGDTDYNGVYAVLEEMGFYGLQIAPVVDKPRRRPKVYVGANRVEGWFVVNEDGSMGSKFIGPSSNAFGVPDELSSPAWQQVPAKVMSDADVATAKALLGKG